MITDIHDDCLLEDGKVALTLDTSKVVDKGMGILHGPSALSVLVF